MAYKVRMSWTPPLATVRVFECAARHQNFSLAAAELGMTQAGVSYQIKILEERLGMALFARQGRRVVLTAQGRRIAPQLTEALSLVTKAFGAVRAENDGVLSVSASMTFATQWLAARLGTFHLRHPGIAVRLQSSNELVDLERDDVDVAIRGTGDPGPRLISHFLMRQAVVPMASRNFLERHPINDPAALAAAPRVSPGDSWWDLWFGEAAGAEPARLQDTVRFDSQVLDGQAALAGQGVAVMSPAMFPGPIARGELVLLSDRAAFDHRSIWLCYAEPKRRLAKVKAFRDWLLAEVRAELADDPFGALVPPDDD